MEQAIAVIGVVGCFWRLGLEHKAFYRVQKPRLLLKKQQVAIKAYYFVFMVFAFVEYLIFYAVGIWVLYRIAGLIWG